MMMTTMTTRKRVLAVATTAIARCPSPKRQRIAGLSRESRRESSEDSAEGEDRQRCRYDKGRTRRRRRQSAGCEGNEQRRRLPWESSKSGRWRTTKATDKNEGQDDNDDTIVGRNRFVGRLKQQSTNEGGTRGEMVMK